MKIDVSDSEAVRIGRGRYPKAHSKRFVVSLTIPFIVMVAVPPKLSEEAGLALFFGMVMLIGLAVFVTVDRADRAGRAFLRDVKNGGVAGCQNTDICHAKSTPRREKGLAGIIYRLGWNKGLKIKTRGSNDKKS
ncbi:MAG: hypothetical protein PHW65_03590 [Dehalococcoidales bacterium]|nr:hypothetical protein [Dehalococcoidales bacterium]